MAFGFGKPFGTATTNAANPGIFGNTATTTSASGKWRFILGLLVFYSIVAEGTRGKIVQLKGERNTFCGLFHGFVAMVFNGDTSVNCEGN